MATLQLSQQLVQTLRQEQVMAPQQIQALEILLATMPELEQRINQELAANPTLELVEGDGDPADGAPGNDAPLPAAAADDGSDGNPDERDVALANLIEMTASWRDYSDAGSTASFHTEEDLERRQFLFDSLTAETSLQEHLLQQLRETDGLNESQRAICAHIIGSIDESGYLRSHPADMATALQAELGDIRHCLSLVQAFDPPGVGARDLRECLLLQLERKGLRHSLEYRLVEGHLEAVERNHIPQVAKALRISTGHVYELLERIRRLNPFPGSGISETGVVYVSPEVYIEKDEAGEWTVRTNRRGVPRLRLAPAYEAMLSDPNVSAADKRYLREKIAGSRMLMRAIDQRQSTIERIAESLIHFQRDFLEYGTDHLRPLVMSQVAEFVGVHETTVSRAIAGKYVQTPHGLFPIRFFFSTGYRADDGEQVSSHAIRQRLQAFIGNEDRAKPLSDQKLCELLAQQGFQVARRTVAKYREELGIAPTHLRRSFQP